MALLKQLSIMILAGVLLATAGCGFQLRGVNAQLSERLSPLYITGLAPYTPFRRELHRALKSSGVEPTRGKAGSAATLHVHRLESDRRILSVDVRNKMLEQELEEVLEFSVTDSAGKTIVNRQLLRATRAFLNPESETLGRRNEEDTIREELRQQLISRLIGRLAAQAK